MKWFYRLVVGAAFCLGCSSEGQKSQWDEFWKDVRGENMEMRNDFSTTTKSPARSNP